MIELEHPRNVPRHPWWPHAKSDRGPLQMAPSIVGSGRQFAPHVHYSRSGDMLKVYWGDQPTFADDLDNHHRVTLERALQCNDLLQGVKIWALSEVAPLKGQKAPPAQTTHGFEAKDFKPFAYYHATSDTLVIRWLPGMEVISVDDDIGNGHPMSFIISTERHPEDPPEQKPWLIVGVRIQLLSLAVPIAEPTETR